MAKCFFWIHKVSSAGIILMFVTIAAMVFKAPPFYDVIIDGLAFDDGKIFSYADRLAIIACFGVFGYLVLLNAKGSKQSDSLSE